MRITAPALILLLMALPLPAHAQAAAESAVILSGTGSATGSASRSLGGSIARGIGNASAAVATANRGSGQVTVQNPPRGGEAQHRSMQASMVNADNDPLEGTDAPAYRLENGATIRVSGRLVASPAVVCTRNCPDVQNPPE